MSGQGKNPSELETTGKRQQPIVIEMPMAADHHPFKGQVVLITGAAQGLGKAAALAFASRGAAVALVDINETSFNDTANELRRGGGECAVIVADITAPGAATAIVCGSPHKRPPM